jgi:pyridoxal phosphate enzyme (YggS family)
VGLHNVQRRIAAAAHAAGREARDITLVAVSKTFDATQVEPVIAAGQNVFGENRVQETKVKWPALREGHRHLELHLIGPLQTNKVADAVALFDVIQTVDRPKLARVLAAELQKQGVTRKLFIQINIGREPQKAGVAPEEAAEFIQFCRHEVRLDIAGVMCIPPAEEEPLPYFRMLRSLARENGLRNISMGMSGDFEAAIAEGATHVRVGSAIFGHRPQLAAQ